MRSKFWRKGCGESEGLINDNIILKKISEFNLVPVKPRILELTDGGPGVGVGNFEVRFRDAEIAL